MSVERFEPVKPALEQQSAREEISEAKRLNVEQLIHRKKQKRALEHANRLDRIIEAKLISAEPGKLSERIEELDTLEALSSGVELNRRSLSAKSGEILGVNQVLRTEYQKRNGEKTIGFLKASRGESVYDADGYPSVWNEEKQAYERRAGGNNESSMATAVQTWSSPKFLDVYAERLIEKYRINPSKQALFKEDLKKEVFNNRLDIDVGEQAIREKAAYTLSRLLKFNIIPPTVVREIHDEKTGISDIASVQEQVYGSSKEALIRSLTIQDLRDLAFSSEEDWPDIFNIEPEQVHNLRQSLIKGACLQWLTGSLDGHHENMFLTDEGFKYIDNGFCFGKARGIEVMDSVKQEKGQEVPVDSTKNFRMMRSVSYEIVNLHKEWKLEEKDQEEIRNLYNSYLEGGATTKAFEELFSMMFENERIAAVQLQDFMLRLKQLASTGRPDANELVFSLFTKALMTRD